MEKAWWNCQLLTTFPANMFDNCQTTNYTETFVSCPLDETSVNNILVSIALAASTYTLTGGTLGMSGATPTGAGLTAKNDLIAAGWTVTTN